MMFLEGVRASDVLRLLMDPKAEYSAALDRTKQLSLYSDCLDNVIWSEPQDVIGKELADMLVNTANLLARKQKVAVKDIKLFLEDLKALFSAPLEATEEGVVKAVFAWRNSMEKEGLRKEGNIALENLRRELIESMQKNKTQT